jgi:cobaltochelatase CobT
MAKLNALYPFRVHDAQSYGRLDSKKLPALVMNPLDEYIYTTQNEHPMRDMALTVLIDNSGSMRGRPITTAAISAEIIAQTLEKCGVKVEILGFTTADWKGGNTKKLWQKNGSSPLPGRLNDLMHIIYKQSHTPYRKAKNNLGVLLKESILKENIDGEALLWAYNRLMNMPQNRKILMVISDGAPVDDSTFSANDSGLLERHLQNMIHFIEKKSPVELVAIGIGHDVSRYYKNAVTIRSPETLTEVMMDSFIKLFDKK